MTNTPTTNTKQTTDSRYEWDAKMIAVMEKHYSEKFGCKVENAWKCDTVLSFTVPTELDAYKAAYKMQHEGTTEVKFAINIEEWQVTVDAS